MMIADFGDATEISRYFTSAVEVSLLYPLSTWIDLPSTWFFFHPRRELQYMLFNRRKAEIEILSSLSVDNGTDDIPDMSKSANKRSTADWLFPDEIENLNQPQEQNISHEGLGTADFTQPLGFLSSELILSSICLLPAITALAMAAVNSHEYERSTCRAKAMHRGDRVRQLGSKCFY